MSDRSFRLPEGCIDRDERERREQLQRERRRQRQQQQQRREREQRRHMRSIHEAAYHTAQVNEDGGWSLSAVPPPEPRAPPPYPHMIPAHALPSRRDAHHHTGAPDSRRAHRLQGT